MNFARLDPIFRKITKVTDSPPIPSLRNATSYTTTIMVKHAAKLNPRGSTTYFGHVGNFTSLDEKTSAAVSKVAKISARKQDGQSVTPILVLVIIVAIICCVFWMCAAIYLTKRASPEEVAALAAKNGEEDRENRRRKAIKKRDSGAIRVLDMEEGVRRSRSKVSPV
jgi:hypothetical protein